MAAGMLGVVEQTIRHAMYDGRAPYVRTDTGGKQWSWKAPTLELLWWAAHRPHKKRWGVAPVGTIISGVPKPPKAEGPLPKEKERAR